MKARTLNRKVIPVILAVSLAVPAGAIALAASADAAYAEQGVGNGNGGGRENNRGGGGGMGGQADQDRGAQGGGKASAPGFLKKLFGTATKAKKPAPVPQASHAKNRTKEPRMILRQANAPARVTTPETSIRPPKRGRYAASLRALNAGGANVNAFINAADGSRIGKIKAYRDVHFAIVAIEDEIMRIDDLLNAPTREEVVDQYEALTEEMLTGIEAALDGLGLEPGAELYDNAYRLALTDILDDAGATPEEIDDIYDALQVAADIEENVDDYLKTKEALAQKRDDLSPRAEELLEIARSPIGDDPLTENELQFFHSLLPGVDELPLEEDPLDVEEYLAADAGEAATAQ